MSKIGAPWSELGQPKSAKIAHLDVGNPKLGVLLDLGGTPGVGSGPGSSITSPAEGVVRHKLDQYRHKSQNYGGSCTDFGENTGRVWSDRNRRRSPDVHQTRS